MPSHLAQGKQWYRADREDAGQKPIDWSRTLQPTTSPSQVGCSCFATPGQVSSYTLKRNVYGRPADLRRLLLYGS